MEEIGTLRQEESRGFLIRKAQIKEAGWARHKVEPSLMPSKSAVHAPVPRPSGQRGEGEWLPCGFHERGLHEEGHMQRKADIGQPGAECASSTTRQLWTGNEESSNQVDGQCTLESAPMGDSGSGDEGSVGEGEFVGDVGCSEGSSSSQEEQLEEPSPEKEGVEGAAPSSPIMSVTCKLRASQLPPHVAKALLPAYVGQAYEQYYTIDSNGMVVQAEIPDYLQESVGKCRVPFLHSMR